METQPNRGEADAGVPIEHRLTGCGNRYREHQHFGDRSLAFFRYVQEHRPIECIITNRAFLIEMDLLTTLI